MDLNLFRTFSEALILALLSSPPKSQGVCRLPKSHSAGLHEGPGVLGKNRGPLVRPGPTSRRCSELRRKPGERRTRAGALRMPNGPAGCGSPADFLQLAQRNPVLGQWSRGRDSSLPWLRPSGLAARTAVAWVALDALPAGGGSWGEEFPFLRRRHRSSCRFPVLTHSRRQRMKVAKDVWTAVALHAFLLLLVSLDGDGVSHLGFRNLWARNLITQEFFI
ncbi:uncharacterized protein LOC114618327 [Grammomys surdaster]|uniref:uncharacterized protein LOC114618327 n=1 Tax=Grammomys surdaster TaxID=491861 RepID=UPI0010A097E5|nr:uncharacterized protein LOC114618327 [Grammomys surdaster]